MFFFQILVNVVKWTNFSNGHKVELSTCVIAINGGVETCQLFAIAVSI